MIRQSGKELLNGKKWKKNHKRKNDLVFVGKISFSSVKGSALYLLPVTKEVDVVRSVF